LSKEREGERREKRGRERRGRGRDRREKISILISFM
jgi:hypothetical protein